MPVTATTAVGLAAGLDAIVGEPPSRIHPVAIVGRVVGWLEGDRAHPRLAGLAIAIGVPAAVALLAAGIVVLAARVSPGVAAAVAGLVLFVATSLRMLLAEARSVIDASVDDIHAAREQLPTLVGRDPDSLSPGEVRSAAVESLAENLADGLVAPLLAFVVGALVGLPVAAGAAASVKAVNTLDSMLGYRDRPLGWASARLDDIVMAVPARLTAVLLALTAGRPRSLWQARRWARAPPSPNSGWPMATLAAAHGITLRKPGSYELAAGERSGGDHELPDMAAASSARRTVGIAGVLAFALAGVVVWF